MNSTCIWNVALVNFLYSRSQIIKKGYEQQQFNNYLLRRCLPGNLIFYAKAEVKNMEYPYAAKDYTGYVKGFSVHQHKTDRHQQRDHEHDPDFSFPGHALSLYIGFQVVFIQPSPFEPPVQLLRASAKAERSQHQKRERRKQRPYRTHNPESKSRIQDFFTLHVFLSAPLLSWPCVKLPERDDRSPFWGQKRP